MQLTELLYQRVNELGGQGNLALRPGYVAVVSRARAVRAVLVASLYPGPDDQKLLSDGSGPARIGVGLLGSDGRPYRLLREIGGGRQLHRFDPAQKKFLPVTEDDLEIASFLKVEAQLPGPESYARFFVLEQNELPSQRSATPAGGLAAPVDQEKVRALRAELEQTRQFEEASDKAFRVSQRLQELNELGAKLEAAERELAELEKQASRSLFTPAQVRDLTSRAQRAGGEQKKQAESLADLAKQRAQLEEELPAEPPDLARDPMLWGGAAGGVAIDALAVVTQTPVVAFLGLLAFGVALVAALRWIDAHEARVQSTAQAKRLKEREEGLKKSFAAEQEPLRQALKTAGVGSPEELVELFKSKDEVIKLRDAARARVDKLKEDPALAEVISERPRLIEEKQILDMTIAAQGFARSVGEIERDLKRELGLEADPAAAKKATAAGNADAEAGRVYSERAAELLGCGVPDLWAQMGGRFGAYLTALTDKRMVGGRFDGAQLVLTAADGRTGPFHTLPQPLRDQAWLALRLSLLERVVAVKKMPVLVDDTFASLDPAKKALLHKMLKGLSAQTQVLHRLPEAPPAGLFDHVVQPA